MLRRPDVTLFGRTEELATLEHVLDALPAGPRGVVLEGEAGVGKSAVWRAAIQSARDRGYQVLEAAPSEADAAIAATGLTDLFGGVSAESLDELPDPQRWALSAALSSDPASWSMNMGLLSRAVLSVARALSRETPAVIAIDDGQWLDRVSARALAFALVRLRNEPVGMLLARRSGRGSEVWTDVAQRFAGSGVERIVLRPLEFEAIRALLTQRSARKFSGRLVRRIYEASGGNALYALAIAEELTARRSADAPEDDLPIPPSLAQALTRRLAAIGPRAEPAGLAVACLAHPTLALIQAVVPELSLSDLDDALSAGVLEIAGDRLRFTHPLLASTLYSNVPFSKRRALHLRIAQVLEDEVARAHHLALSADAPDAEIADALERAARTAARRGGPDIAAELFEAAVRLTPIGDPAARCSRTVAAAEQRLQGGELARSRALLEGLIPELSAGLIRAHAYFTLALTRAAADVPVAEACELLEKALADAGSDHRLRVRIERELAEMAQSSFDFASALEHAHAAVEAAEKDGDPGLIAQALAELAEDIMVAGQSPDPALLDRAASLEPTVELSTYYLPTVTHGRQLMWTQQYDLARPILEAAARRALERGEQWDLLGLLFHLAELECEAGDLQAAEGYRAAAERERGEWGVDVEGWLDRTDASIALARGDLERAISIAERGLTRARQYGYETMAAAFVKVLAAAELLLGDPAGAHERHRTLRERITKGGNRFMSLRIVSAWCDDVEALIALGRLDEAADVLAAMEERVLGIQNPHLTALVHRSRGLLLAARGDLPAALREMEAGLAEHARRPVPLELGRTLLEKGSLERRMTRKTAAKETLEQAIALFERIQASPWLSRARAEHARIGVRRARTTDGLTPVQHQIAELVTGGMSNREIARRLHMSESTVEKHLTRAYREIGVRSRSQLAAAIAGSDQPGSKD